MNKLSSLVVVLGLAAIGTGTWLWLRDRAPEPAVQVQPATPPAVAEAPADTFEPPEPVPEIRYPIDAVPAAQADAAQSDDVGVLMTSLLGRDTVLRFLQMMDFPRRVAATVDNLGRNHAAPTVWPVTATPGRFTTRGEGATLEIDPANYKRYDAFTSMAQSIDVERAVAVYVRLYPRLQEAYEELGYPRGYFNDRVVAVIDNLLATPDVDGPVALELTEVKGEVKPERPWVRYRYANPDLESLSAGQKMLVRVGPAHRQTLKLKLRELRRRLAGGPLLVPQASSS